ncbi:hypothetical protein T4D_4214 [Trichinella pseudospiralis]|uniref:Uncharacterized protein n=1 Tax=Trichinella pseudospiralis TaxID=6337 RepID=A0A0V1DZN1_TRIPS|nr:hypothetical protein T4D_4214 [Trichinella pseudospiralis]
MQKSIVLYEDITLLENTSTQLPGENRSWFQKWLAKVLQKSSIIAQKTGKNHRGLKG